MNSDHAIKTILDFKDKIKLSGNGDVPSSLLEMAITEIDQWKELADDFASCIVITQGEIKPRISVDIEKFLETQHNYKIKSDGL
jgi:hypothetical protein